MMRRVSTILSSTALLCAVLTVITVRLYSRRGTTYSWMGHNFPENIPGTNVLPLVELTVEESVHYSLANDNDDQWASLAPVGFPYVRLGPESRLFAVSMYHQMHCLRRFNRAFGSGEDPHHIRHCLSYLRHAILCGADLTLEPGDFAAHNFARDRVGQTHVCRDWTIVRGVMDANWEQWKEEKWKFAPVQ